MAARTKNIFIGIDLGGTHTKIGLIDLDQKKILKKETFDTKGDQPPQIALTKWAETISSWNGSYKIKAIGIGSPGPIDKKKGCIIETPNLKGWENFSFTKFLKQKTKLAAFLEKDATVALLGEWQFGKAKKCTDFVLITLGTGIGSGVVVNNTVLQGHANLAPEIGHMTISTNGKLCECGKMGCLEAEIGGAAFLKTFNSLATQKATSVQEIFERAIGGDSFAVAQTEAWSFSLAVGLGNVINIFNPQKIVIGGGISKTWPFVKKQIAKNLLSQAFKPSVQSCEIVQSTLGNDGALLGAALHAQKELQK